MTVETLDKPKIKFLGRKKDDFFSTLKFRVENYFDQNKISRFADWRMYVKTAFWLSAFLILYYLIVAEVFSKPVLLVLCMLIGIVQGYIGVNISHDALHGAYSSNPAINRWLGFTFDLCGLSSYVWKMTHNYRHHIFTNIHGADHDIDKSILLRLAPKDPWYPFHRLQHIYIMFLYGLVGINWVFYSDYAYFFKEYKKGNVPREEIVPFFFFKLLNLSLLIAIPLMVMDITWWQFAIGYFALQFAGGFAVALVFQLAHLVEDVQFPVPDEDGVIHKPWAEHEVETSANFGTNSFWVNWVTGGLNFQIEHHLFPYICHVHYKKISPIVKATAQEFGLPYVENDSVWKAVISHVGHLKHLGQKQ